MMSDCPDFDPGADWFHGNLHKHTEAKRIYVFALWPTVQLAERLRRVSGVTRAGAYVRF